MTTATYTDVYDSTKSSVIDRIAFDAETDTLYVQLLSEAIYAYEASRAIYEAFAKQEFLGGSAGVYWNEWIKPNLKSVGSPDELVDVNEVEDEYSTPKLDSLVSDQDTLSFWAVSYDEPETEEEIITRIFGPSSDPDAPVATILPVNPPKLTKNEYGVTFEFEANGDTYESELSLFVDNGDLAVDTFFNIAELAGYENVKITSVTRYYA